MSHDPNFGSISPLSLSDHAISSCAVLCILSDIARDTRPTMRLIQQRPSNLPPSHPPSRYPLRPYSSAGSMLCIPPYPPRTSRCSRLDLLDRGAILTCR